MEANDLGNYGSGGVKVSEVKQIRVEFDCSKALAPEILSVRFSDSATALVLVLSMPGSRYPRTAATGLGSPFYCAELLTNTTVAMLGNQDIPRCQWEDDSTLVIGLGSGATIRPQINKPSRKYSGDYVTIIDGVDGVSGVGFNCPTHIFKMKGEGATGLVFAPLTPLGPLLPSQPRKGELGFWGFRGALGALWGDSLLTRLDPSTAVPIVSINGPSMVGQCDEFTLISVVAGTGGRVSNAPRSGLPCNTNHGDERTSCQSNTITVNLGSGVQLDSETRGCALRERQSSLQHGRAPRPKGSLPHQPQPTFSLTLA